MFGKEDLHKICLAWFFDRYGSKCEDNPLAALLLDNNVASLENLVCCEGSQWVE